MGGALAHRGNKLVGESFGGYVENIGVGAQAQHPMSNGVHQMSFAQAGAAVKKQRIIIFGWAVGHRQSGRVGKTVAAANHKAFKIVAGIKIETIALGRVRVRLISCLGLRLLVSQNRLVITNDENYIQIFIGNFNYAFL